MATLKILQWRLESQQDEERLQNKNIPSAEFAKNVELHARKVFLLIKDTQKTSLECETT